MGFKNFKEKSEGESPRRTIYASGGLGLLQMVSELDIGRCASEEAEPRRGVDTGWCAIKDARPRRGVGTGWCAIKDARPRRGWIGRSHIGKRKECWGGCWALKGVDCEISHWLGRRMKHSL